MHIVDDSRAAGAKVVPKPAAPAERRAEPKPPTRRGSWLRWAAILGGLFVVIALVVVIGLAATTTDDDATVPAFEGAEARMPAGFVPTGWEVPERAYLPVPEPLEARVATGFSPSGWEAPEGSLVENELLAPEQRLPEGFIPVGG